MCQLYLCIMVQRNTKITVYTSFFTSHLGTFLVQWRLKKNTNHKITFFFIKQWFSEQTIDLYFWNKKSQYCCNRLQPSNKKCNYTRPIMHPHCNFTFRDLENQMVSSAYVFVLESVNIIQTWSMENLWTLCSFHQDIICISCLYHLFQILHAKL